MTPVEFKQWLDNHRKLIPSVNSWLQNQSDVSLILDEWAACLSRAPLELCKAATQAIVWGQIERPWHEDTAATVRKWASDMNSQTFESRKSNLTVSRCALCDNTGTVEIWHPLLVRAVREGVTCFVNQVTGEEVKVFGADEKPRLRTVGVACSCQLGDRMCSERRVGYKTFRALPRFDERDHVRRTQDWEGDIKRGPALEQRDNVLVIEHQEDEGDVLHAF